MDVGICIVTRTEDDDTTSQHIRHADGTSEPLTAVAVRRYIDDSLINRFRVAEQHDIEDVLFGSDRHTSAFDLASYVNPSIAFARCPAAL